VLKDGQHPPRAARANRTSRRRAHGPELRAWFVAVWRPRCSHGG